MGLINLHKHTVSATYIIGEKILHKVYIDQ